MCGNKTLIIINNVHLMIVICTFGIAVTFRSMKWALFVGIVGFFYFVVNVFHCEIKALDQELTVRYLIWVSWSSLSLLVVYFCERKRWVLSSQAIPFYVITSIEVFTQLVRYTDRHIFELRYTSEVYSVVMPVLNNLFVIVCAMPIIVFIKNKLSKYRWI